MAKKKSTPSVRSFTSRRQTIEPGPIPTTREAAAYARLAHPTIFGLYYCQTDPINPWVERGYTRWPIAEWEGKYGNSVSTKTKGEHYLDQEGRKWEFFGYTIPLYDDPKT